MFFREDFIGLLSDILVRDFGYAADEAERLIKTHSTIVSTATLFHSGTGDMMMSNILPCVIALEMAENRRATSRAIEEYSGEHDDKWWREMFAKVRANLRAKMVHLDHPPVPPVPPESPDVWDAIHVRDMCEILIDESANQDDKYMALMTLVEILFPDRPIFRDTTDASDWPPSSEQVDAVIAAFAAKADAAGHQGASDEPYWAVIVAMEWVLGRPSTADGFPCYVTGVIKEVTGYGTTATPEKLEEKLEEKPEKLREGHDLLEACRDLLGAMKLQQIADEANGNSEAAASCQPFIDKARAAIAKVEGAEGREGHDPMC